MKEKEEDMKRKERKRGARRIFAGAMAALMVLSAVDVNEWGVLTAKAEETAAGKIPQYLIIGSTRIIDNGEIQDDGVSSNEDTIYQGTNWYYDSTKNQFVLDSASISGNILSQNGDIAIILSGTNTMRSDMMIQSILTESGIAPTLEINGNSHNGSLSCGKISIADSGSNNNNLNIIGATVETSQIDCSGSLTIENSHVVAGNEDYSEVISSNKINIVDSYVETKATTELREGEVIKSNQPINISGSQIVVSRALASQEPVLSECDFSNSVITKQWKDADTDDDVTKTYVYGTATLKENLTIASGESIEFKSGASISNPEKLTLEDGASLLVDGVEHEHNTNGDVVYTWKDDNEHVKGVACKDCPIGYVTEETETHSISENGFCACNQVYQPANLTTDKYDIDGDDSVDEVYEISNAGQLYWFAGLVNGTLSGIEKNISANAVLTADIVVNENILKSDGTLNEGNFKEWTPIGTDGTSSNVYTGTFDGRKYTISGLYFNQEAHYIGLFGANSGKIANVGILDSYFYGQPYRGNWVGGVCGYNTNQGAITNCYNTGIVRGSEAVGGVCGSNSGIITNCSNTGNVGENDDSVGGVSGNNYGTIANCNNAGIVSGKSYVGGVCGKNYNGGTVTNCNNTGEVEGTSYYIGGLSGDNYESVIINCNNTGEVRATGNSVGGLSGGNSNGATITNCYYDSTIYTGNAIGANDGTTEKVEGKTTEQYKTGEVAYLLQLDQTEEVWGQTIGTDTYPTLGGAKVYKNATYNGCEGKPGDAVSYEYSNTEKNTYGEHIDADNDGKCDDCDAIIDGIGAKLAGYSLSLTGNIGVNFYMELSDKIIADENAYMQFTLPNGTVTKVPVSEAQTNTTIKEGTTYYRFPCEVSSYEMTQDIKAQMFDGNGNCGKEYTYTVRDYAQYILNHVDLYVDTYPFAVAMLNYGACSQKYFNQAVEELANKYLNDDGQEIPDRFDGYIDGFVAKKAENDVLGQFAGLSMVLKSETTLNLFYEPKEGIDVSKLIFSVDGKEITPIKRGQYYILSLENIGANELGNSKTFTVTDGTNTLSGDYCAMMYCYQVLNAAEGTYKDDLVTLVKAFSNYAYTARSVCQSN